MKKARTKQFVADGGTYPLTEEALGGLTELLGVMSSGTEVVIFTRYQSTSPVRGQLLAPGTLRATLHRAAITITGEDLTAVVNEPGDEIYYDIFHAGASVSYCVNAGRSVTFVNVEMSTEYHFFPARPVAASA